MNHPTIRRVVTGHDAQGKAVVKIDAPCGDFAQARPNGFVYNIWTTDTHPANNDGDADAGRRPGVFTSLSVSTGPTRSTTSWSCQARSTWSSRRGKRFICARAM